MADITIFDPRTGERLEGEAAIQSWIDRFDINLDGKVEYPEIVSAIASHLVKQQETEQ